MHRKWKLLFFALCLLVFSGCGGQRKSSGYRIGIDPSWYPLQLEGQQNNVLAFSIELLVGIAKQENLEFSIVNMSWDNLLWGLREKKYDGVFSAMRPYTFYLKDYNFSDLFLETGPVLVVPISSKLSGLDDVSGKEIAVIQGSSAALLLQKIPGVILRSYNTIPLALEAVEKQKVDMAAVEILIAQNYVRDLYAGVLKIATGPLSNEGLRLLSLYSHAPKLIKGFDAGLKKLKKSGFYQELLDKWGLSPDGQPAPDLDRKAKHFLQSINL